MTIDELQRETLTEKNTRLRQEKCRHPEVWSSSVRWGDVKSTSTVCVKCGKNLNERDEA